MLHALRCALNKWNGIIRHTAPTNVNNVNSRHSNAISKKKVCFCSLFHRGHLPTSINNNRCHYFKMDDIISPAVLTL